MDQFSSLGRTSLETLQEWKDRFIGETQLLIQQGLTRIYDQLPSTQDMKGVAVRLMRGDRSFLSSSSTDPSSTSSLSDDQSLGHIDVNGGSEWDVVAGADTSNLGPFSPSAPDQSTLIDTAFHKTMYSSSGRIPESFQDMLHHSKEFWGLLVRHGQGWWVESPVWTRICVVLLTLLLTLKALEWIRKHRRSTAGRRFRRMASGGRLGQNSEIMYHGRSLRFEPSGAILEEHTAQLSNQKRRNSDNGPEILRSGVGGRGRFGSFDFFGMHDTDMRTRRNSTGSLSDLLDVSTHVLRGRSNNDSNHVPSGQGDGGGKVRRERLGSMDMYVADVALGAGSAHRKNTDGTPLSNTGGFFVPAESYISSPAVRDDDGGERYLYDEFGAVTLSHKVEYYGPSRVAFETNTYTPPTSWAVASRRIIPTDIMTMLERRLRLDTLGGKLEIATPTTGVHWDFQLSLDEISMYVQRPLEGGVVSIYVKGTPKEEWMEHTFQSAHSAAQFQLDLLAYQTLGKTVQHIFETLNLIHQGSLAYDGQEFVLHDVSRESNEKTENAETKPSKSVNATRCVTWDDAMRSLSSIPTVRIALERLWLSHRHRSTISSGFAKKSKDNSNDDDALSTSQVETSSDLDVLTDEYAGKRLLLGPLDFFRLFVPALPYTAIPAGESNRGRMEQLLSWRKRVARAAVLVRTYSKARRVVNLGWRLKSPGPGSATENNVVRRLAYDGNEDNNARDTAAKMEVYEASVSRDVICFLRPFDYLGGEAHERDNNLVLSPYQAYSYIGSQFFKVPEKMAKSELVLDPSRDPVETIPSLQKIITENPDLDFFVLGTRLHHKNIFKVDLFVRSLSKGIDPQFDQVVNRFTKGTQNVRDRKLHIIIQLGDRMGLSYVGWLFLRFLSFFLQLTRTGRDLPKNLEMTRDRFAFPAFKIASFFKTYHFGGTMQKNTTLPSNYVATVSEVSLESIPSLVARLLFMRIQRHFSEGIVDLTYFFEGDQEDELPERALCTLRQVHIDPEKAGIDSGNHVLPVVYAEEFREDAQPTRFRRLFEQSVASFNSVASMVASPLKQPKKKTIIDSFAEDEIRDFEQIPEKLYSARGTMDPVEEAVDSVIEILQSIDVPTRVNIPSEENGKIEEKMEETGIMMMAMVPVLKVFTRHDVERFVRDCDFDIGTSGVRLVQTAAWRGKTFPLDKRKFRIELHNGQFFQQGIDLEKNPVFYFRNMCRGPWRGDEEAAISAILYQFDKSLSEFTVSDPNTKATVIILMGAPAKQKMNVAKDESNSGENHSNDNDETTSVAEKAHEETNPSLSRTNNPRVSLEEHWNCHTSPSMMHKLVELISNHYPERVSKALVVRGRGKNTYYGTVLEGRMKLKKAIVPQKLRSKIIFANKTTDLVKYVAIEELVTIVGGERPIPPSSYEF